MAADSDDCSKVGAVVISYGAAGLAGPTIETLRTVRSAVVVRNPRYPGDVGPPLPLAGIEPIVLAANLGYAAAVNAGISALGDMPYVLVLTHDAVVPPEAVRRLVAIADADPGLGAVGPRLTDLAGGPRSSGGTCGPLGRTRRRSGSETDGLVVVDWTDGAVVLARRTVIDEVGGFDPSTFMYVEEVEWCWRVRRAGYRVAVAGDVVVAQRSGGSSRPGAHAYLIVRNNIWLSRRVAGWRGTVAASVRGLLMAAWALGGGTLPKERPWRDSVRQTVGAAWGIVDGVRRRSGPPPTRLARWGDIVGTVR